MYYTYVAGLKNLGPNTCIPPTIRICRNCMHQFPCFAGIGVAAGDHMRVSPIKCGQPMDFDVFLIWRKFLMYKMDPTARI